MCVRKLSVRIQQNYTITVLLLPNKNSQPTSNNNKSKQAYNKDKHHNEAALPKNLTFTDRASTSKMAVVTID